MLDRTANRDAYLTPDNQAYINGQGIRYDGTNQDPSAFEVPDTVNPTATITQA
jgi:hypothetical protein